MLEKVDLTKKITKDEYKGRIDELRNRLGELQRQARDLNIPVIVVVEGWDAAGKGTLINEMIQALDPRGFNVYATQAPNEEESLRPYLWRFWTRLPSRGRLAIFDRSWYRRLLFERIDKTCDEQQLHAAFHDIPAFERQLADDGYLIIKLFLHISKKVQADRLKRLAKDPAASWRVTERDWQHHKQYDEYLTAIEEMIQKTDTSYARWTIVEAHNRRFATVKLLTTLVNALEVRVQEVTHADAAADQPLLTTMAAADGSPSMDSSVITQVDLSKTLKDDAYQKKLKEYQERIREIEYMLYRKRIPVVVLFEGWDAAGKGGAIRRLTQNMDPRGYTVVPIAAPSDEEKEHPYLWRFWRKMPKAGHVAIFDRSWYGRVLVERVEGFCRPEEWRRSYQEINEMEEQWINHGAVVVKFWMHIDKEEQRLRFEERTANPEKQWKITGEDWRNREKWAQYEAAVDEMFLRTSTLKAPWTIVEANSKNYARIKVLDTVIQAIEKKL